MGRHDELLFDEIGRSMSRVPLYSEQFNQNMSGIPIYELTNVAKLFDDDWTFYESKELFKRPPHERMWVEWEAEGKGDDYSCWVRNGLLISRDDSIRRTMTSLFIKDDNAKRKLSAQNIDVFDERSPMYFVKHFFKFTKVMDQRKKADTRAVGKILQAAHYDAYVFSPDYLRCAPLSIGYNGIDWNNEKHKFGGFPALPFAAEMTRSKGLGCWPPLMCFALLHCKNIVEETVQAERTSKNYIKRGYPPRVSYKVLRIEVPCRLKDRRSIEVTENHSVGEPMVRFHLCRGHIKTMRHPKFKEKVGQSYWCPDHWKGDPDLGVVVKDYKPSVDS